jgi:hypothetical protein
LSFAAAVLLVGDLLFVYALPSGAGVATISILLAPIAFLLVMHVHAEPWARLAGYVWAALALITGVTAIAALVLGGDLGPAGTMSGLTLLAAAAWIVGASMSDDGPARALGGAAALGVALAGILDLTEGALARGPFPLARYVQILSLGLFVIWLVLLGRDLTAGRRRWRAVA